MTPSDGETHWFEGAQFLAVYAILAVVFYFCDGIATLDQVSVAYPLVPLAACGFDIFQVEIECG